MSQTNSKQESENRRCYFRIDDDVYMHYRVLTGKSVIDNMGFRDQRSIDRLTVKAKFEGLSQEMRSLHHGVINSGNHDIAQYLAAVDKKLNILSEYFIDTELKDMDMELQHVNIGAGGMGFSAKEPIEIGSILEFRIILLPENTCIFSRAKTVACKPEKANKVEKIMYHIAVEFNHMNEEARNLIARHILRKERESINSM